MFKNAPAGDFHLAYNSPCFGAGTNFAGIATLDLDLQPRVRSGGAVDMGAYELPLQSGPLVTFQ